MATTASSSGSEAPSGEPGAGGGRAAGRSRDRVHAHSVARRIPPHVTLLDPFVAADTVGGALLGQLRQLYAACPPFEFTLDAVEAFPAVAWLAPNPRGRLVELIRLSCARFPERPPYGGAFADQVPHLTVGTVAGERELAAMLSELRSRLRTALPIGCRADGAALMEEQLDGSWAPRERFPCCGR